MTTTHEPNTRSDQSYGTDPGTQRVRPPSAASESSFRPEAVSRFVSAALAEADLDGERVCLVVPDGTRTCPLPLVAAGGVPEPWPAGPSR